MAQITTQHDIGFEQAHPRLTGMLKILLGFAVIVIPWAIWQWASSGGWVSVNSPVVPILWLLAFLISLFRQGWRLVALGMVLAAVVGIIVAIILALFVYGMGVAPAG